MAEFSDDQVLGFTPEQEQVQPESERNAPVLERVGRAATGLVGGLPGFEKLAAAVDAAIPANQMTYQQALAKRRTGEEEALRSPEGLIARGAGMLGTGGLLSKVLPASVPGAAAGGAAVSAVGHALESDKPLAEDYLSGELGMEALKGGGLAAGGTALSRSGARTGRAVQELGESAALRAAKQGATRGEEVSALKTAELAKPGSGMVPGEAGEELAREGLVTWTGGGLRKRAVGMRSEAGKAMNEASAGARIDPGDVEEYLQQTLLDSMRKEGGGSLMLGPGQQEVQALIDSLAAGRHVAGPAGRAEVASLRSSLAPRQPGAQVEGPSTPLDLSPARRAALEARLNQMVATGEGLQGGLSPQSLSAMRQGLETALNSRLAQAAPASRELVNTARQGLRQIETAPIAAGDLEKYVEAQGRYAQSSRALEGLNLEAGQRAAPSGLPFTRSGFRRLLGGQAVSAGIAKSTNAAGRAIRATSPFARYFGMAAAARSSSPLAEPDTATDTAIQERPSAREALREAEGGTQ